MMKLRSLAIAASVAASLFISPLKAQVGQPGPGQVMGNSTATTARAQPNSLSAMFNRGFCSTSGGMLANNSGTWGCLSLGANTVLGSIAGGTPAQLTQTQLTSLINQATASLPGAMPAWPNNTTTFLRGDDTFATLNFAALGGSLAPAQCPTFTSIAVGCVPASGGGTTSFLRADGAFATPAGGGTVTTSGTPAAHQTAVFTGSTVVEGIAAGSTGQALVSNGTGADPSYQSGMWVLLNTLTASNSPSLSDTTHFTGYNEYQIVFENIVPVTTNVSCQLQVNTAGGLQSTGYVATASQGAAAYAGVQETTFIPCAYPTQLQQPSSGVSGEITGYNFGGATGVFAVQWRGTLTHINGTTQVGVDTSGAWNATTALTGITITMSSGNISAGKVKIYGRL